MAKADDRCPAPTELRKQPAARARAARPGLISATPTPRALARQRAAVKRFLDLIHQGVQ